VDSAQFDMVIARWELKRHQQRPHRTGNFGAHEK